MITKIILQDFNDNLYELPHNILKLSSYAFGKATSLEVSIITSNLYISKGDKLLLYIDGNLYFTGTIFAFSQDYNSFSITAYNNLIYFKSKDTMLIKNQTASAILSEICTKLGISCGEIIDTTYVLPYFLFENTSYFDIISDILSSTYQVSGNNYMLYDDLGSICLTSQNSYSNIIEIDENILLSTYQDTSAQDVYNAIHVYQISTSGDISSFYALDETSISLLGKIQKSLNVDRNLSVAQCNLIAQNTLLECQNAIFSIEIQIIALTTVKIYDIILINLEKYQVLECILNISSSSETYTLTLEKVVE